jgi:AcrR family transcriptional regulator
MNNNTKEIIFTTAKTLFAKNGYEGFSMRTLVKESGIGLSSIYHFYKEKDTLLEEIFNVTNRELGIKRSKLKEKTSASIMLYDRILFQFKNIEDVVFVLKYYIHFRTKFMNIEKGILPAKAYLHIEEVLRFGVTKGEFIISESDIEKESKVIAHAINGFLLEYFPLRPKNQELIETVESIHLFLMRSLTNKEVMMI